MPSPIPKNRLAIAASGLVPLALLAISCASDRAPMDDGSIEPPPPDTSSSCDGTAATPASLRLLTRLQYDNTVSDLLGDTTAPARDFPPENVVLGFENNAEAHRVTPLLVEELMEAAEGVAARAVARGATTLAQCGDLGATPDCAQTFIQSFGLRAFRRPLTAGENALYVDLFQRTSDAEGFDRGIELLIQAILEAPQFLYRADARLSSETPSGNAVLLDGYTMASRLSYFLYDSMPDEPLFEAATKDELRTVEQIRAQARRMIDDPRARGTVEDFHRQWLGLGRLPGMVREVALGQEDPSLGPSYAKSLNAFVTSTYWDGGDVESLFLSPTYFVDAKLAPLFGASAPADDGTVAVTDRDNRAGLLTQPALLALYAHENQSSPIQRGVFVRERILCQAVPAPPPTVDQTPPDPNPTATTRERFRVHTEHETCSVCHRNFDGIGLGLENYDQLGRYRDEENGLPIDANGELFGTRDPALVGPFNGAIQLSKKLADSYQVKDCIATQWYRFAMGRVETTADLCSLENLKTTFAESGDLRELLVNMTLTDAFRFRQPLAEDGQ
jgi:hypothetical protein